ncbi:MmgE/PrpD family protein [Pseudonocardia pini]|uniref:MmgE/PrpD family protein n=1 Tax=Pseudonocardia pini TaxID=2758030 RepID=UPI0015F0E88C|nr:MmgE/PrpD family protein [Pseudonocardia pini]
MGTGDAILERVAGFAADLRLEDVPDAVVERTKLILLHNMGVAVAGYRSDEPALMLARETAGPARLFVDGSAAAIDAAVLANAAMMHARTQDDSQLAAQTHIGCTTLPALLALADHRDASGTALLEAMVVGYEAASAVGRAAAAAATARGFRATSVFGAFGAAAACAKLLGLSPSSVADALACAAAFGGGVNQTWVSGGEEWQYQPGVAGRNGLTAALLAERGLLGARDALEGGSGLYRAVGGDGLDAGDPAGHLGRDWMILQVTPKAYPVCAFNQAPVGLAVRLRRHTADLGEVTAVRLSMPPSQAHYPGIDSRGPFAGKGEALMSARFCVAVALSRGRVGLQDLTGPLSSTEQDLVGMIDVVSDGTLPDDAVRLEVDTAGETFALGYDPAVDAPTWDRAAAEAAFERLQPESPQSPADAAALRDLCLGIEARTSRALVEATFAPRPSSSGGATP